MRLTDIMSGSDLTLYPKVALVLFLIVFFLVLVRTYSRSRRAEMEAARLIPLDDEPGTALGEETFRGGRKERP